MRTAFSSDDLPAELSNRARFKLWHDIHNANIASLEYTVSDTLPFYARMDAVRFGTVALGSMAGRIQRAERHAANIAEDGVGGYNLFVNAGTTLIGGTQAGREFLLDPGDAVLMSSFEPLQLFGGDENAWTSIILPDTSLNRTLADAENRTARRIGADNQALRLLRQYGRFLRSGPSISSPDLVAHASRTIVELVGLTLRSQQRPDDLSGARGVRAARLLAVSEKIRERFSDPAISAQQVAREVGLSVRYVHELLHEAGASFGERVMELRLQESRRLLSDRRCDHLRVSDIALQCGFSDISYFNRSFRRRFGCTPVAAR